VELIVVRHGLPEKVENLDGSPADPPLSAQGRAQALRVCSWLQEEAVDRVYSSPLRRAVETAAPLCEALGLEAAIEPGVAEFDRDAAFYTPLEELKRTDYPRYRRLLESEWLDEFDAETFRRRVVGAMERIIADNPGRRVAVFCHGGVINFWAAHVLSSARTMFFHPQYTSINRFRASRGGHRGVHSLNELGHLRP